MRHTRSCMLLYASRGILLPRTLGAASFRTDARNEPAVYFLAPREKGLVGSNLIPISYTLSSFRLLHLLPPEPTPGHLLPQQNVSSCLLLRRVPPLCRSYCINRRFYHYSRINPSELSRCSQFPEVGRTWALSHGGNSPIICEMHSLRGPLAATKHLRSVREP